MAERLGSGLQIRLQRFNSASHLQSKNPDFIGVFSFSVASRRVRRYSVLVSFFVFNCGKQYHGCTTSFFRGFFVPRFRAPVRGNPRRNAACGVSAFRPARCPSRTCAALLCAVPCVPWPSGSSSANVRPTREGAQPSAAVRLVSPCTSPPEVPRRRSRSGSSSNPPRRSPGNP